MVGSKMTLNFKDIIDISPDSVMCTDENFRILYMNKAAEELYGWDLAELIGNMSYEIFSAHPPFEEIKKNIHDTAISGNTYFGDVWIRRKDGTFLFCECKISALLDKEGNVCGYLGYHNDITDQRKIEKKLKESEERLHTLYEYMPGGTLIIGRDYIIKNVNRRTCEITGYSREELIGQLCDKVCPKGSSSKKCPIWEEGNNGFQGMDTTIKCHDGEKKPILKNAKVVTIDGEEYILESFQDISELKDTQEKLIIARMTAEEANRTKSEFLATMNHELRTPLTSIIGFSDILLEENCGSLTNAQKRYSTHITNSGNHLLELINNILDISKFEAGRMELNCEHFTTKEILEDVESLIYPTSVKKNIDVKTEISPDDLEIYADKIKFKQIMYNLLNNAVKFTPQDGNIRITARYDNDQLSIEVSDTGIGISPEEQNIIFQPFRQVDSAESRKYQGTGLGLALVKQLVELHNGTVEVESEVGKGSTFKIKTPIKQI
ncbi:PAS domain-containing sensor histidine kinase [Methanolobus sp. ZRKC3]|uniref:PAS domain-containing sensor histidine kinase n=1 Tax=Methanolobus sp. ZRKC3 TaxID=3125786 RepID=UPI003249E89B